MRTIIYGPSPSGKTFHSNAFRELFGCDEIVDWTPPYGRLRLSHRSPGENALVLTNASEATCRAAFSDARILSIVEAKRLLANRLIRPNIPEIAFPIAMPDGEGYVMCHRHDSGDKQDWFLHPGCRVAYARPNWAGGSILVHILGGLSEDPAFEEEGCAILLTTTGLRQLGAALIRIASESEAA